MQSWAAGLAKRASAKSATKWGGWACLVAAARDASGIVITLNTANKTLGQSIAWGTGASLIPIIIATAGIRLLRGSGRLSGSVAVLIMSLDLAMVSGTVMSPTMVGQIVAKILLLLLVLNGIRGAFALRHVDYNTELKDTFS